VRHSTPIGLIVVEVTLTLVCNSNLIIQSRLDHFKLEQRLSLINGPSD
jgi:hypothetical protein